MELVHEYYYSYSTAGGLAVVVAPVLTGCALVVDRVKHTSSSSNCILINRPSFPLILGPSLFGFAMACMYLFDGVEFYLFYDRKVLLPQKRHPGLQIK